MSITLFKTSHPSGDETYVQVLRLQYLFWALGT